MRPIAGDIPNPLGPPIQPPPVDVYVLAGDPFAAGDKATSVSKFEAHSGTRTVVARNVDPSALAVDSIGNVFVNGKAGEWPPDGVYKYPAGGEDPIKISDQGAEAMAADRAGDIFVLGLDEFPRRKIMKIGPGGGQPNVFWTLPNDSIDFPMRVAADSFENVYIFAVKGPSSPPVRAYVVKVAASGGQTSVVDLPGIVPPSVWVADFTVDPQGQNCYAAWGDVANGTVAGLVRVPLNGDPRTSFSIDTGVVEKLAVDVNGNVYIADYFNDRVDMVTSSGRQVTVCEIPKPFGLALKPPRREIDVPVSPQMSRLFELIGKMFGGAAVDGGGWVVIGNTVIPIPPRSPVMEALVQVAIRYMDRATENPELAEQLRALR
jgi:hypothetical protein